MKPSAGVQARRSSAVNESILGREIRLEVGRLAPVNGDTR